MVEIYYDAEDLANIDQLICAQDFANIEQRIYLQKILTDQYDPSLNPSNGSSNLNDEATGIATSTVNMNQ